MCGARNWSSQTLYRTKHWNFSDFYGRYSPQVRWEILKTFEIDFYRRYSLLRWEVLSKQERKAWSASLYWCTRQLPAMRFAYKKPTPTTKHITTVNLPKIQKAHSYDPAHYKNSGGWISANNLHSFVLYYIKHEVNATSQNLEYSLRTWHLLTNNNLI